MSQGKYDLIDYVNYVEYITIMRHMIFSTFCKYEDIYYCDANSRIDFWQKEKKDLCKTSN
jgi:hypothetical protein